MLFRYLVLPGCSRNALISMQYVGHVNCRNKRIICNLVVTYNILDSGEWQPRSVQEVDGTILSDSEDVTERSNGFGNILLLQRHMMEIGLETGNGRIPVMEWSYEPFDEDLLRSAQTNDEIRSCTRQE